MLPLAQPPRWNVEVSRLRPGVSPAPASPRPLAATKGARQSPAASARSLQVCVVPSFSESVLRPELGDKAGVVEACADLPHPDWAPLATNTLTGGSSHFSDPQWTNYPSRYYRLRSP